MDISILLKNKYLPYIFSGLCGVLVTLITQKILNKRGLFTYIVHHIKVGTSTDDAIYGSVRVTWNDNPVSHLYISTLELFNQSMKDYEDVIVRIFSNDTTLLTHRTEIIGTTHVVNLSKDYEKRVYLQPGTAPTENQIFLASSQREYIIPTMNRGQKIRFQLLNAAISEAQPNVWLDIVHKGVKLKYQVVHNSFLGVPQPYAAFAGVALGIGFLIFIAAFIKNVPLAAISAFIFGLFAQVPGAFVLKIWHRFREWFAG